jgi:hypothetical protein
MVGFLCWVLGLGIGLGSQDTVHLVQQVIRLLLGLGLGLAILSLEAAHLSQKDIPLGEVLGRALLGRLARELVVELRELHHLHPSQRVATSLLHTLGGHLLGALLLLLISEGTAAATALGLLGASTRRACVILVLLQPGSIGIGDLLVVQGAVVLRGLRLQRPTELQPEAVLVTLNGLQDRQYLRGEGTPLRGRALGLLLAIRVRLLGLPLSSHRGLHRGRPRKGRTNRRGEGLHQLQTHFRREVLLELGNQLGDGHLGNGRHFGLDRAQN